MLPIISPATPDGPTSKPSPTAAAAVGPALLPSPSSPTAKSSKMPIFFDARVAARRDDGWEDMLERTLLRWTSVVVEERRNRSRWTQPHACHVLTDFPLIFSFGLPIYPRIFILF
jgi:hypothetical protein